MAKYFNELSSSGTTLSLQAADGFENSTVFGNDATDTHQFSGSVYISGNLRAWTYKVDEVVSGSTIFGNDASDTHQFTGSVLATGPLVAAEAGNFIVNLNDPSGYGIITGTGGGNMMVADAAAILSGPTASVRVGLSPFFTPAPGVITLTDSTASLYVGAQPWATAYPGRISLTASGGVRVESSDIQISDGLAAVSVQSSFGPFGPLVQVTDATASLLVGYPIQGAAVLTDQFASIFVGSDLLGTPNPGTLTATDGTGSLRIGLDSYNFPAPGAITITSNSIFGTTITDGSGTLFQTGGGIRIGGPEIADSQITFEVHYTGSKNPVVSLPGPFPSGGGESVYYGTGSTTPGTLYYLNTVGGWEKPNANATGSLGSTGAGNASLLGIALGFDVGNEGMLTKGYYNLNITSTPPWAYTSFTGSWVTGSAVYIYSGSDAGVMTATAPSEPDSYVRIVGYCTTTPNVIYFNPDSSWIENGP